MLGTLVQEANSGADAKRCQVGVYYRQNPDKCRRVFADLDSAKKEGIKQINAPGGYVQDLWDRWLG